jgi:hypothetical protein
MLVPKTQEGRVMLSPRQQIADGSGRRDARQWLRFALNVLMIGVLYVIYEFGRGLIRLNGPQAIRHAHAVWSWEVRHGLFVEPAWQHFWLTHAHGFWWFQVTHGHVMAFLNSGYLYVHFLSTILFLVWMYCCRPKIFPFVRSVFFLTTALASVIYILYPMAPPRLTPLLLYDHHRYTFIDTIAQVLGPGAKAAGFGYNPYAAMPSLHFSWALIIGCTLCLTLRPWPLRLLSLGYPAYILLVIVVSGNHFFADALGAVAVVSVATFVVGCWEMMPRFVARRAAIVDPRVTPNLMDAPGV